jgi:NAD-dependent deacetylase
VVIVNAQATPYDGIADAVLRASIGETLPRILTGADVESS